MLIYKMRRRTEKNYCIRDRASDPTVLDNGARNLTGEARFAKPLDVDTWGQSMPTFRSAEHLCELFLSKYAS